MRPKFTRDAAIWWVFMTAGLASYTAANYSAFPFLSAKYQPMVQAIAAGLTSLAAYLRLSPLPLSPDHPMATDESSQSLTITGHPKE